MRPPIRYVDVAMAGYASKNRLSTIESQPQLRDGMIADIPGGSREIDVLRWMGRAALELVGQGALGYSFDALVEDSNNNFADAAKSFLYAAAISLDEPAVTNHQLKALR